VKRPGLSRLQVTGLVLCDLTVALVVAVVTLAGWLLLTT
jgi:hypothetical protein